MPTVTLINNPESLLPANIIKKSSLKAPLDSAEFHFLDDQSLCIFLLNSHQRILVARKQGDVFRTWRSVDRAVGFIRANFTVTTIQIHLNTRTIDQKRSKVTAQLVGESQ